VTGGIIRLTLLIQLLISSKGKILLSSPAASRIPGIALIVLLLACAPTTATTLNVDDSGGVDYKTIQGAINAASPGDTVLVFPGTYNENIVVHKTVHLTSTGGASATNIIAADSGEHVFNVSGMDGVTISGFNVSGATGSSMAGIYLRDSNNNTLTGNMLTNNSFGIYVSSSHFSYMQSGDDERFLSNSSNNTLIANRANNNTRHGIYLSGSINNNLADNTANDNTEQGIYLSRSSNNNLTGNTANNNDRCGIIMHVLTRNNILADNTACNNYCGIYMYSAINNTLKGNTVEANGFGISLDDSSDNLIYNNIFNNTDNIDFDGINTGNRWNITKQAGTNIAGGSYLGGNYWLKPDGTGFSQINNSDVNTDGISDLTYIASGTDIDYLPLVRPASAGGINTSPESDSTPGFGILLTAAVLFSMITFLNRKD
jgi:parallel beta-helix repeat protein